MTGVTTLRNLRGEEHLPLCQFIEGQAGAVSGPVARVVGPKEEDRVEDVAGTYGRKEVGQMANNLGRRQSASDRRSWSIVSLI